MSAIVTNKLLQKQTKAKNTLTIHYDRLTTFIWRTVDTDTGMRIY